MRWQVIYCIKLLCSRQAGNKCLDHCSAPQQAPAAFRVNSSLGFNSDPNTRWLSLQTLARKQHGNGSGASNAQVQDGNKLKQTIALCKVTADCCDLKARIQITYSCPLNSSAVKMPQQSHSWWYLPWKQILFTEFPRSDRTSDPHVPRHCGQTFYTHTCV